MKRSRLLLKTILPVLLLALSIFSGNVSAQAQVQLSAGRQSPEFSLKVYPNGKGVAQIRTRQSYLGRWLVLEFWTKTCISCIKGFPKLQLLSDSLKANMAFLLVGKNDEKYNSGIRTMYQRIASEENLSLDIAYDTLTFKSFGVWATPHAVVISPEGMIASISVGSELSLSSLKALINRKGNQIAQLETITSGKARSPAKPDITDSAGLSAHKSELDYWQKGHATSGAREIASNYKKGVFLSRLSSLSQLYLLSEFGKAIWSARDSNYGKIWPRPVLELADSTLFQESYQRAKGLYRYRLNMTDTTALESVARTALKSDLNKWFGYQVKVVQREMPILKLISLDPSSGSKLASKGADGKLNGDYGSLSITNLPVERLRMAIASYFPHHIIIDGTGIIRSIDLSLQGSLADLYSLRKALQKNGLDLLPTTKIMDVLIITGER